jgi:predicted porin
MQKKIIALAVAALASGAAMAQSNVTIYGIVDIGYAVQDASSLKSTNRIESAGMAGSRIGFKGVEDLGSGWKALFTLEYNLANDTNSGIGDPTSIASGGGSIGTSSQSRQTFVGLTGDYGTVVAGRLQAAGYYFAVAYTPFAGTNFDNASLIGGNLVGGSGARLDNAVAYVSPTFYGLTFEWDHARVTETASSNATGNDSNANEVSLTYANGPISAQAVYLKIKGDATAAADDSTQWGLGASYDFGVAKVMGMYKTRLTDTNVSPTDKTNSQWSLSASIPAGPGTILASYARSDIKTRVNSDASGWGIGYRYPLSKRTTIYANYTSINQDSNGNLAYVAGLVATGAVGSQQNAGVGADSKIYGFGINHAF